MTGQLRRPASHAFAAGCWSAAAAGYVYTAVTRARLADEVVGVEAFDAVVYGAALFSSATVGFVVAVRQRRHPVGWVFLALGAALSVGGAGDTVALNDIASGRDPSVVSRLALVAGQASFIAWFALVACALHLTPTGRALSRRWRIALVATIASTLVGLAAKAVQDTPFPEPYAGVRNPWAVDSAAGIVNAVAAISIALTTLGLLVAAVGLVVRYRRSQGQERQQLRWMALIAVPMPVVVMVSVLSAVSGWPLLRTAATGGYVLLIPVAAGLSVLRYRLYDVERVLSRAAGYVISSVVLATLYIGLGAGIGRVLGGMVDDDAVPAAVAAATVVGVALPLHRHLQELVDKRFDRRRFDALRLVRDHVRRPSPDRNIEDILREALHDPALRVAYWLADRGIWVTAAGQAAKVDGDEIAVDRHGEPLACLRTGPETDRRISRELAGEAIAELDNVRLRAEIALQLVEVRQSRTRIIAAQAGERHRIERNLHDGAQQRLLALAMQLRASQLHNDRPTDPHAAVLEVAVEELTAAVRELRELANGLYPSVLTQDGLGSALDELLGRVPLDVDLVASSERFDPNLEEALWFVACEAVANTVKHAQADHIWVALTIDVDRVCLSCRDDGRGGACADGAGLRGLADRVDAVGGALLLTSPLGGGTNIEVVVPCGS